MDDKTLLKLNKKQREISSIVISPAAHLQTYSPSHKIYRVATHQFLHYQSQFGCWQQWLPE